MNGQQRKKYNIKSTLQEKEKEILTIGEFEDSLKNFEDQLETMTKNDNNDFFVPMEQNLEEALLIGPILGGFYIPGLLQETKGQRPKSSVQFENIALLLDDEDRVDKDEKLGGPKLLLPSTPFYQQSPPIVTNNEKYSPIVLVNPPSNELEHVFLGKERKPYYQPPPPMITDTVADETIGGNVQLITTKENAPTYGADFFKNIAPITTTQRQSTRSSTVDNDNDIMRSQSTITMINDDDGGSDFFKNIAPITTTQQQQPNYFIGNGGGGEMLPQSTMINGGDNYYNPLGGKFQTVRDNPFYPPNLITTSRQQQQTLQESFKDFAPISGAYYALPGQPSLMDRVIYNEEQFRLDPTLKSFAPNRDVLAEVFEKQKRLVKRPLFGKQFGFEDDDQKAIFEKFRHLVSGDEGLTWSHGFEKQQGVHGAVYSEEQQQGVREAMDVESIYSDLPQWIYSNPSEEDKFQEEHDLNRKIYRRLIKEIFEPRGESIDDNLKEDVYNFHTTAFEIYNPSSIEVTRDYEGLGKESIVYRPQEYIDSFKKSMNIMGTIAKDEEEILKHILDDQGHGEKLLSPMMAKTLFPNPRQKSSHPDEKIFTKEKVKQSITNARRRRKQTTTNLDHQSEDDEAVMTIDWITERKRLENKEKYLKQLGDKYIKAAIIKQ